MTYQVSQNAGLSEHSYPIQGDGQCRSKNQTGKLDFLWLEITNRCNLQCVHCYADSSPSEAVTGSLTTSDWISVLSEAKDLSCGRVQFIGGEPLIHPDLRKMIYAARSMEYDFIEVYTNATKLNQNWCDFFKSHGVHVATSFYSSDPDIHASITKRRGSFSKTVAGIKAAVDANLPVRVGIIDVTQNEDTVETAKRFLHSLGIDDVGVDRNRLVGRGAGLTPNQCKVQGEGSPYSQLCGSCAHARLAVTATGRIFPCVFSRFYPVGEFLEQGLAGAVNSKILASFRQELQKDKVASQILDECRPGRCEPEYDCNPGCLPTEPDDCSPALCRPGQ